MQRTHTRLLAALLLALPLAALLLALPLSAAGQALDPDEADALVRARWFEGMPEERIAPLGPEAVAHLAALLRDPEEAAQHAPSLELLGRAGGEGAFEALAAYARQAPSGELDGARYRAQLALPLAWGALARRDARALAPLRALARDDAPLPGWRHRHLDGARLRAIQQRLARGALERAGFAPDAGGEGAR